ncbi:MAG: PAS domain-containing protein [Methanomassiliicoccales archaeon]|nr:MAG: PAS domain-containing protein [Methanomassiliicoccales archaeon]
MSDRGYDDGEEDVMVKDDQDDYGPARRRSVFKDFCNVLKNFVTVDELDYKSEKDLVAHMDEDRAVMHTNKDLEVTYITSRCKELLGLKDEVIGKSVASAIPTSGMNKDHLEEVRRALVVNGERFRTLTVSYEKGRDLRWIQFSIEKSTDASGAVDKLIWTCKDVTGSVLFGSKGTKADQDVRPFIEAVPIPLLLLGKDLRPRSWNGPFLDLFGMESPASDRLLDLMLQKVVDAKKLRSALLSDPDDVVDPVTFDLVDGRRLIAVRSDKRIGEDVLWSFKEAMTKEAAADMGRKTVDNLPVNVWETDAGFKVLSATKGLERLLGHEVDDMVGYSLMNIVCDEDRDRLRSHLRSIKARPSSIEVRMLKADGDVLWMRLDCQRLSGDKGLQPGYMIVGGDVSEKKFMERSLSDLVYIFNFLMNHIHEGVWIIDQNNRLVQWNMMMESITGVHSSDALGKTLEDLSSECEGFDEVAKAARNVVEKKRSLPFNNQVEVSLRPVNGVGSDVVVEMSQMMTENGRVVMGVCSLKRPIVHAVPALGAGDVFKNIVDNSPDLIVDISTEGEVLYCNKTMEKIVGRDVGQLIGYSIKDLFMDWPVETYSQAAEGATLEPFDLDVVDTDGRTRTYHINRISFDKETSSSQFYGREMTEVIETKKMLGMSEEMKRLLLETHPAPVFLTDPLGSVVYMNREARRVFGSESEVGCLENILDPVGLAMYAECVDGMEKGGPMKRVSLDFHDREGRTHRADVDVEPIADKEGAIASYLVIFSNLEAPGTGEDGLARTLGTADDLSGPSWMEDRACLEVEQKEEEGGIISTIEEEVELLEIANDNNDVITEEEEQGPGQNGRAEVADEAAHDPTSSSPRWIPLRAICDAALEEHGEDAEPMGTIDNIEIFAVPDAMNVISELVDNSFTHGVTTSKVDVKFFIGDKGGYLVVEDDGKGIPPEKKGRIFDKGPGDEVHALCRLRNTLATTGIVIDEVSEQGRGARFELFIPDDRYRRIK